MTHKPLHTVVAISIPAIEAWLLCPEWTESKWRQFQNDHPDVNKQRSEKQGMKGIAYGSGAERIRRPRADEVEAALGRLVDRGIDELPERFPLGVGQALTLLRSFTT